MRLCLQSGENNLLEMLEPFSLPEPDETPDPVVVPFSNGELLDQIYAQLGAASANEVVLERSWMRLGEMLRQCKEGGHWRAGFETFDDFMADLRTRYRRGKTQLWAYLTVAEKLLPMIPADTLEEIGISKALELKRAVTKSGKPVPVEIIQAARKQETTIKELRAMIGASLNIDTGPEKGSWFDFDGCYFTPDERKEFVACVLITERILGLKPEIPDHIRRKEIFLAWAREFLGTHAAEVLGPGAMCNTPATLILPPGAPNA